MNEKLVAYSKPYSIESEQFKIIRTKIDSPRIVMMTSAQPGEGKSFVAANLAVSISQSLGKKAVLIDCDLRRPVVHKLFEIDETPGLTEYLSNIAPLDTCLKTVDLEDLLILPGGQPAPNPAELFSSERISAFMEEIRSRLGDHYVFLDSPPPLLVSEARTIAKHVDNIILVIKYGATPKSLLDALFDTIGKDRILGAVINKSESRSHIYKYIKGYKKYYSYYK